MPAINSESVPSLELGDGRAILLGEVVDRDGVRRDIQLKGLGRRRFPGAATGARPSGPVLREYLVSEAMAALGIPTTRALAAVTTGETILRETALPGAVLVRVASSHIRIGTFQFFAARGDEEAFVGSPTTSSRGIIRKPPTPRTPIAHFSRCRDRASSRACGEMAPCRLYSRRHEHRQHVDCGRDDRLRSLRFHGRLPSGDGLQFDRRNGPLCL